MNKNNKCPKCQGEFEEGSMEDKSHLFLVTNPKWVPKKDVTETKKVSTYRCKNCGYLESYAN